MVYLSYEEAKPVLEALTEMLPEELKSSPAEARPAIWPGWVARKDAEIRRRLEQGDEDTLANFLLFGTSFTRRPRITAEFVARARQDTEPAAPGSKVQPDRVAQILAARVEDLARALAAPGTRERLLFLRRQLERQGQRFDTPAGRRALRQYLYQNLARVQAELDAFSRVLQEARQKGDPEQEFVQRSSLFQNRGISLDATLFPNFAIEESLAALRERGLLKPGSVRRVAILGPGLDFVDKEEGFDFYPPQSIQSFAVADSLLRLGLAKEGELEISALDISSRVLDHLSRARGAARQGRAYVVNLPLDARIPWTPEAIGYWEHFGDQIGTPVLPRSAPGGLEQLKVRAVRIRPALVSLTRPFSVNIVWQRLDLKPDEGFDLIIATNIFVYYGVFEQSLALVNVERMLRPGGFLLSNNALLELPVSRVRSVDYSSTVFSDRPGDGEQIVWYRRVSD